MNNLESLLEQSNKLPSLPEIYIKVSDLLESEHSTVQQIGKAVQTDFSLTARILKMINCAYIGLPNQVTSISQAVALLGRQQLKQILMGSVLAGVFSDKSITNFCMRDFWHHSIKTALIARHLAMQNVHIIDHEAFFTAGLLHDIGRLVIAKVAPDSLLEISEVAQQEDADSLALEAENLGVTHVEVGVALMKKWGMPSLVSQCVAKHHEVVHVGPFAIETSMLYLANQLSHQTEDKTEEMDEDEGVYADEAEERMQEILSAIPNWRQSDCTLEQITIACKLADEQWLEVMESLGMAAKENIDSLD